MAAILRQSGLRALVSALLLIFFAAPFAAAVEFEVSPQPLVIETDAGPVNFTVELALTPEERSQGLMNRSEMADDAGMLFDFGVSRPVTMWMKNTILPLDMIFIGEDGRIAGVAADTVPFSENIVASPGPVRYVLEVNAGTAAAEGIEPGDRVVHPVVDAASE